MHRVRVLNHLVVLGLSMNERSSEFKLLRSPAHITAPHVIGVCRHLTWNRRKSGLEEHPRPLAVDVDMVISDFPKAGPGACVT